MLLKIKKSLFIPVLPLMLYDLLQHVLLQSELKVYCNTTSLIYPFEICPDNN